MIVLSVQTYFERFAEEIRVVDPGIAKGIFQSVRYRDGEACVSVRQGVEGQDCLLVGTVAPPDNQMLEFLMLADAIKRGGARTIWAFLPYLAYSRQDKLSPGQAGGIATVGSLFKAVGINGVVTVDLHSRLDSKLVGLPVLSLMSTSLFANQIKNSGWQDMTVVAPDEGAIHRNEALAEALGVAGSVVHLVKTSDSIVHLGIVGDVGPRVVLADDILDSGRTLVSACNVLHQHGVQEIVVAVTHGLFNGEIWKELFGLGIKTLYVTDSCPSALKTEQPQVAVISIRPLIPTVLTAVRKEVQDMAFTA